MYEEVVPGTRVPVKSWTRGVIFDENAKTQVRNTANMPFIFSHVAVMPDVHLGAGATIGTVIATKQALIPAAVGVDIGCGMEAVKTTLKASDLPSTLHKLRIALEEEIPVGNKKSGSWEVRVPKIVEHRWLGELRDDFETLLKMAPNLSKSNHLCHLGTMGGGNHFLEICLDEEDYVWILLHSGSRGIGNSIGCHFINRAIDFVQAHQVQLQDRDLSYLEEGTTDFDNYWFALSWAQRFAKINRELMLGSALRILSRYTGNQSRSITQAKAISCHHNYATKEFHFGEEVYVTRKGAVRAQVGDLGIIPSAMKGRSFIVEGLGNPDSFNSCSHGAGRVMSRTVAKQLISVEDHIAATEGVECRKDAGVVDESPMAYKDIVAVMNAQSDLVRVVTTLNQIVNIKG